MVRKKTIDMDDKSLIEENKEIEQEEKSNYFLPPEDKDVQFFSTGCTLLDCSLGGGWAEKRIFNIKGDKSTSKSLLCIEAFINFLIKHPEGRIVYVEAESTFNKEWTKLIGLEFDQKNKILIEDIVTIEQLYNKLVELSGIPDGNKAYDTEKINKIPTLVIVDTWDGLSDASELERDIEEGSYGGGRPKKSHELFRKLVRRITNANITLGIISQVKDNINVTFGDKETIACKHAIEFWSTQRLALSHLKIITETIDGIERAIGNRVKAKCIKNKVGKPFRVCDFTVRYDMGINDLEAHISWLDEIKRLTGENGFTFEKYGIELPKRLPTLIERITEHKDFEIIKNAISGYVKQCWNEIESKFKPPYKKY